MLSLIQLDNDKRVLALQKLGYEIDDSGFVYNKSTGEIVICKYSKEKVHINTAAILPGSVIIINASLETMAQYFLDSDN